MFLQTSYILKVNFQNDDWRTFLFQEIIDRKILSTTRTENGKITIMIFVNIGID
jgi:hypothetical protein